MNSAVIGAIVGALAAVVSTVVSHYLLVSRLRAEAAGRTRADLAQKQLAAYQKFWSLLGPTSSYATEGCVLQRDGDEVYLASPAAEQFCRTVTAFFFSEHGLFLSRPLRDVLFGTRDLLLDLLSQNPGKDAVRLSNTKLKKIERGFRFLYLHVRDDLGLRDPQYAKSEFEPAHEVQRDAEAIDE